MRKILSNMLVLDTSVVIEIEKGNSKLINKLLTLRGSYQGNLAITSAVYAEFLFGFMKIGKTKDAEKYIENFDVLNFDSKSAAIFAFIKKGLEDNGKSIPIFDLITASSVISNGGTLVTLDAHFNSVPQLDCVLLA